jgi:hypothetical protein
VQNGMSALPPKADIRFGSVKLRDRSGEVVRLTCERCGRRGQYGKTTLIARHGPEIPLPNLRVEIAR